MVEMRSVWKLIVKCVCVMMPFIVLGCRMEQNMLAFADGEIPFYIWNREKTNATQDKRYRVVILGDSTPNAAYVPEILSQDTINLSIPGSTPMESYYVLKDWLENNAAPDACYFSFVDSYFNSDSFFWTRAMYSHRFRIDQNLEMLQAAISYQEPSILTGHYWLDFISYQMYLPNKYMAAFMNASFNQRYQANIRAKEANELHGGRHMTVGTAEYMTTDTAVIDEFHVSPFFDSYYKKLIELCIEYDITPRIVKLPLPDSNQFTDHYKESFDEYYEDLQKKYPSITVDWFPLYPMNLFADGAHMNSHGALRFSMELKELHPEDFSTTEMDENQIAAIDDSIRGENKIEWILKWIDGKDYTVLFYDKRGEFKDMYEDRLMGKWLGTDGSPLAKIPIEEISTNENEEQATDSAEESTARGKTGKARRKPDVWAVFGEGAKFAPASVSMTESGLSLQLDGQEPMAWETTSDDVLGVAVVNNYSHTLVCMKSFRYVDEDFALMGG